VIDGELEGKIATVGADLQTGYMIMYENDSGEEKAKRLEDKLLDWLEVEYTAPTDRVLSSSWNLPLKQPTLEELATQFETACRQATGNEAVRLQAVEVLRVQGLKILHLCHDFLKNVVVHKPDQVRCHSMRYGLLVVADRQHMYSTNDELLSMVCERISAADQHVGLPVGC
jgi:hypothetical protein